MCFCLSFVLDNRPHNVFLDNVQLLASNKNLSTMYSSCCGNVYLKVKSHILIIRPVKLFYNTLQLLFAFLYVCLWNTTYM